MFKWEILAPKCSELQAKLPQTEKQDTQKAIRNLQKMNPCIGAFCDLQKYLRKVLDSIQYHSNNCTVQYLGGSLAILLDSSNMLRVLAC
jgi:hypothetical protein